MKQLLKELVETKNLVFYLFVILAVSLTWSTVQVIQENLSLQGKLDGLRDEISVLQLENKNLTLGIEYYKTDAFLELEARRTFNKVGAGENVVVLPRDRFDSATAARADEDISAQTSEAIASEDKSNFSAWLDFLLGRS